MNTKNVRFRYYAELNDFLSKEKHKISFDYHFSGRPTVKDAIEACGVPHPEVEIILANDRSVGFYYIVITRTDLSHPGVSCANSFVSSGIPHPAQNQQSGHNVDVDPEFYGHV